MEIPEINNSIVSLIDEHHERQTESPRAHLGCSLLGHPCDRWLWLSFRWAVIELFPGRIRRLFRRGHNEEAQIVSDLRAVGIDVRNTTDNQQRVKFGAHVSGSIDGVIESGVPDAPKKRHIAEFKTHSKKSFDEVIKSGVEKSKPMHWAQMQVYMLGMKIDRALYVAVCKDDDRLYTERVRLNKEVAQKIVDRGRRITLSDRMPEPLSADPTWYQCRFCAAHQFCFETKTTTQVNCRTCANVTINENDTITCERYASEIPTQYQLAGCECHVLHPDLIPWQRKDSTTDWQAVYIIHGKTVANGEPDANVFSSKELIANSLACSSGDEFIESLRKEYPESRIIG